MREKIDIISEKKLFLDGIKPAILTPRKLEGMHFNYTIRTPKNKNIKEVLIINNELCKYDYNKSISFSQLGKILGYFPDACYLFEQSYGIEGSFDVVLNSSILNFCGIDFNTMGLDKESLDWCIKTYGNKCMEKYGYYHYQYDTRSSPGNPRIPQDLKVVKRV